MSPIAVPHDTNNTSDDLSSYPAGLCGTVSNLKLRAMVLGKRSNMFTYRIRDESRILMFVL